MGSKDKYSGFKGFALKAVDFGNKIEKFQLFIGFLFIVAFLGVVFFDVLLRTAGKPILWSEEIARFSYMWAVFIGSGIALRRGSHFKIDFLTSHLHGKVKKVFDVIEFMCIAIFVIILVVPGYKFALMGLHRVSNPSGIPLIFSSICIPLGGIFMAFYMIEGLIARLAEINIKETKADIEKGGSL